MRLAICVTGRCFGTTATLRWSAFKCTMSTNPGSAGTTVVSASAITDAWVDAEAEAVAFLTTKLTTGQTLDQGKVDRLA